MYLTRSIEIDTLNCNTVERYSDLLKTYPDLQLGSLVNYVNEKGDTGLVTVDGAIMYTLGDKKEKIIRVRVNIKNQEEKVYFW